MLNTGIDPGCYWIDKKIKIWLFPLCTSHMLDPSHLRRLLLVESGLTASSLFTCYCFLDLASWYKQQNQWINILVLILSLKCKEVFHYCVVCHRCVCVVTASQVSVQGQRLLRNCSHIKAKYSKSYFYLSFDSKSYSGIIKHSIFKSFR